MNLVLGGAALMASKTVFTASQDEHLANTIRCLVMNTLVDQNEGLLDA